MRTIRINQKKYEVPELTFKHLPLMEKSGLSLMELATGKYIFTTVEVFTSIVAGCSTDVADHLLEQHIRGGGSIIPIFEAFVEAMNESDFFKTLLEKAMTQETPAAMQ